MNKINFKNSSEPAINGENLNQMQENIEKAIISAEIPIGAGMDYFGTVAPDNYMFADGSAISRIDYANLFAVIGTKYGAGDGSTTFNLPDKRERVSVMYKEGSKNFGTLGKKIGSDTHKLTIDEMPSHNHTFTGTAASHNHGFTSSGTNVISQGSTDQTVRNVGFNQTVGTGSWIANWGLSHIANKSITPKGTNSTTGGGQEHNNIQQSLVCNYIIRVK